MEQFIQTYPYNQLFENNADSHFYMKMRVGIIFKNLIVRIFLNELFHRDTSSSFIPITLADEIFAIMIASLDVKIFSFLCIQPLRKNLPQTGGGNFHHFPLVGFFL